MPAESILSVCDKGPAQIMRNEAGASPVIEVPRKWLLEVLGLMNAMAAEGVFMEGHDAPPKSEP